MDAVQRQCRGAGAPRVSGTETEGQGHLGLPASQLCFLCQVGGSPRFLTAGTLVPEYQAGATFPKTIMTSKSQHQRRWHRNRLKNSQARPDFRFTLSTEQKRKGPRVTRLPGPGGPRPLSTKPLATLRSQRPPSSAGRRGGARRHEIAAWLPGKRPRASAGLPGPCSPPPA